MVENHDSSLAAVHKVLNFVFPFKTSGDIFYIMFIPVFVS